jgi:hypothetical protein
MVLIPHGSCDGATCRKKKRKTRLLKRMKSMFWGSRGGTRVTFLRGGGGGGDLGE